MPRGEHFRKDVENSKILDQFDREDLDREMYTTAEIASGVPELTEGAVRNRMRSMEEVESEKFGNTKFWFRAGVDPFADGGEYPGAWVESRARALRTVFGSEAAGERRLKVLRDLVGDGVTLSLYALAPAVLVETFTPLQGVAAPLATVAVVFGAVWVLAIAVNSDDSLREHIRYRLGLARDTRDSVLGGDAGDG